MAVTFAHRRAERGVENSPAAFLESARGGAENAFLRCASTARAYYKDMKRYFPKHTVQWHFEEPTVFRRFSLSLWEVAIITGVLLRLYRAVVQQGLAFGFRVDPQPPIDANYEGEGPLRFGRYGIWVYHTPGHCPGGVCLAVGRDDDTARTLFVGDTLFAGSIGRTDLPGGDLDTLLRSIREVLFRVPDETVVHPGHGESTTIGRERRTNPFLTM